MHRLNMCSTPFLSSLIPLPPTLFLPPSLLPPLPFTLTSLSFLPLLLPPSPTSPLPLSSLYQSPSFPPATILAVSPCQETSIFHVFMVTTAQVHENKGQFSFSSIHLFSVQQKGFQTTHRGKWLSRKTSVQIDPALPPQFISMTTYRNVPRNKLVRFSRNRYRTVWATKSQLGRSWH